MPSLYGKRQKPMPPYTASDEEWDAYRYCVRNNIRISPYGIQNDTDNLFEVWIDTSGQVNCKIIDTAMIYALNFDLQTPNFNDVKVVSLHQILDINNNHKIKTSKRLGFKFSSETNND